MKNDNLKVNKESNSHYIGADKIVYRTDLGNSSKIVSMSHQNTSGSCIKRIDKYTYYDKRVDEIKYYDLDKPVSIKDVKRKVRKYEEIVMYNFQGGKNELFITLTCRDKITDLKVIKDRYKEFLKNIQTDYKDLECIALFETTSNSYWHIHLFLKYVDTSKVLTIPHQDLLNKYWTYGAVHIIRNFNTFKSLGHSKDSRQEKLERLTNFPKGCRMYMKTRGIKTPPKEKKQFKDCPEFKSSDYSITSAETYMVRNEETDKIVNAITTIMYRNNKPKIEK
ncbi:MAG: hypothetical protein ACLTF2_08660 [Clostridia bacterium]